jgi:hypothetical protein
MRFVPAIVAAAVLGAASLLLETAPAGAVCSVFDRHPCAPTVCSVFRRGPCIPEYDYPIGQDLRLTIESAAASAAAVADDALAAQAKHQVKHDGAGAPSEHRLDTLREFFDALRACWVPPASADARPGMQMSVRLSFKRTGEIIGTPRLTYVSPDAPAESRDIYRHAIDAALERCTPLPFTTGLGGAIAGRPIAIRFVDNRPGDNRDQPQ